MDTRKKPHLTPDGQDLKEEETKSRMRVLWTILIVLVLALIAAIVYEIVLGNGMQQTGSERMEEMGPESERNGEATEREMLIQLQDGAGEETDLQTETDAAAGAQTEEKQTEGTEAEGTEAEETEAEETETEAADTEVTDTAVQQQNTGRTEGTLSGNEPALAGIGGV